MDSSAAASAASPIRSTPMPGMWRSRDTVMATRPVRYSERYVHYNDPVDELVQRLSANLRRCRERHGMSLGELAAAAGLAKSTLHALEQGSGNPTLNTVWGLATALAVPLGELLDDPSPAVTVLRAGDGPVVESDSVRARLLHRLEVRGVVEIFELDVRQRRR